MAKTRVTDDAWPVDLSDLARVFQDFEAVLASEQANQDRLAACVGPHEFDPAAVHPRGWVACKLCGGTVKASESVWYARGLKHAKG